MQSQIAPLPEDLPFRFVSQTIGRGAFASIKKAVPLDKDSPVFAVKLIHKDYAVKRGRISLKQITTEVALHAHIGLHRNVIEWFATGEDLVWRWIAMEYAAGGDLFDKIEADVGVPEDIAHLYFRQLVSGVSFVHSKGVAHRDLKPENILLSGSGHLKLADFGLATMFEYKGARKQSGTTCGSPPYIAPEVLACGGGGGGGGGGGHNNKYAPDVADLWSCGVILFVLLVGNTPWDEPLMTSSEFYDYATHHGRSSDPLWAGLPADAVSLLRGMMNIDPQRRFGFTQIRQHPWFTRPNRLLAAAADSDGADRILDPIELATQMLGNLRIDLRRGGPQAWHAPASDAMDVDVDRVGAAAGAAASQPVVPVSDASAAFAWTGGVGGERPGLRSQYVTGVASTQPVLPPMLSPTSSGSGPGPEYANAWPLGARSRYGLREALVDEPAMSQFSQARGVPVSLTQKARRFRDIVPAEALTRFLSHVPPRLLVQMLCAGLHQLNIPAPTTEAAMAGGAGRDTNDDDDDVAGDHSSNPAKDRVALMRVRLTDGRKQSLAGHIAVQRRVLEVDGVAVPLLEAAFVKVKGDPLEWRRFFKKMVQLCRDGIFSPDDDGDDDGR